MVLLHILVHQWSLYFRVCRGQHITRVRPRCATGYRDPRHWRSHRWSAFCRLRVDGRETPYRFHCGVQVQLGHARCLFSCYHSCFCDHLLGWPSGLLGWASCCGNNRRYHSWICPHETDVSRRNLADQGLHRHNHLLRVLHHNHAHPS